YDCFMFFFSSRRRHTRFSRDWSSDVCSSDLITLDRRHVLEQVAHRVPRVRQLAVVRILRRLAGVVQLKGVLVEHVAKALGEIAEIGRASCRERGEISGGGGAVKKIVCTG